MSKPSKLSRINTAAQSLSGWLALLPSGLAAIAAAMLAGATEALRQWAPLSYLFAVLAAALATALISVAIRHLWVKLTPKKRLPPRERTEFSREVLNLSDLVEPDFDVLMGKRFSRCLIRGPGAIKFQSRCTYIYSTMPEPRDVFFREVAAGTAIGGTILVFDTDFFACHFENICIVATQDEAPPLRRAIDASTTAEWRAKTGVTAER